MGYSLNTTIINSSDKQKPENAVILCHGYGGDGKDISILANYWKNYLPKTVFICPDAPEKCTVSPTGFQWFDLSKNDEEYILKKSLEAENIIKQFIEEVKIKYNIFNSNIILSGFSQGCMIYINVGLSSEEKYNCIVGFSGKIINKNNLQTRIKNKTKTLLIHGDQDEVVSSTYLLEAKDFFDRNKINIDTKLIKNSGHNIPLEASSLALDFIKKSLKE